MGAIKKRGKSDRDAKGSVDFGFDRYLSPFTWRYGSEEMRRLFSEENRRLGWRRAWLALAAAEAEHGLLSDAELSDIRKNATRVDVHRAHIVEKEVKHDLMAELSTFAEQAKVGGGRLHLGATSADVEDNADVAIYREATGIILDRISDCLRAAKKQIMKHKGRACIGWTHLQPAEPTTVGYRLAGYAQDLATDVHFLEFILEDILLGKGLKGAVGTSASFTALTGGSKKTIELEDSFTRMLGLKAYAVSGQTYPRKADYLLLAALASVAQSCYKFGFDIRVLQSPMIGEISEGFGKRQVGSSAMPFKRNPVKAERMCSLARFVSALPSVGFSNAANSILERTLDDSAARRIVMPEAFLALEECLALYEDIIGGLLVSERAVKKNLEAYGPFAGTEPLMMELVKHGLDRQKAHELIRKDSVLAWEQVERGQPNGLPKRLAGEKMIASRLSRGEVFELMDSSKYTGEAERRCEGLVRNVIDPILSRHKPNRPQRRTAF